MPRYDSTEMAQRTVIAQVGINEAKGRMWGIAALLVAWVVILSLVPLFLLALVIISRLRGLL